MRILVPFVYLLLTLTLSACLSLGTKKAETISEYVDNPRQTVAWTGVYQGIQPCAACSGVATMLSLEANGQYTLRTRLLGKEDIDRKSEGRFVWLDNNTHIKLNNENPPQIYHVSKDFIELTTPNGQPIPSADKDLYRLHKTN